MIHFILIIAIAINGLAAYVSLVKLRLLSTQLIELNEEARLGFNRHDKITAVGLDFAKCVMILVFFTAMIILLTSLFKYI